MKPKPFVIENEPLDWDCDTKIMEKWAREEMTAFFVHITTHFDVYVMDQCEDNKPAKYQKCLCIGLGAGSSRSPSDPLKTICIPLSHVEKLVKEERKRKRKRK